MSEGWDRSPRAGTEIDAETDDRPEEAQTSLKGGWVALPPHPDAPESARTARRYRAPWAAGTTASLSRSTPTPAPSAAPTPEADAPARPKSRRFSLKREAADPVVDAPAKPKSRRFSLKRKAADRAPVSGSPAEDVGTFQPADAAPPAPPAVPEDAAGAAPAPSAARKLEFTGSAGEYFRIWIVNVCLTVLTLGIYSAWAKVRTKRYFYRHTQLEGSPFDYLAEPKQILKGRTILVLFMGTYGALGQFMPDLQAVLSLALIFLVPWAVVKTLKFRARTSAWRNIRFGFDGTFREALAVFVGWPILVGFTFGLAYPYYQWRRHRFVTERSRFGNRPFAYQATPGEFYGIHLKAGAVVLGLFLLMAFATLVLPIQGHITFFAHFPGSGLTARGMGAGPFPPLGPPSPVGALAALMSLAFFGMLVLSYLLLWTFVRARTWNVVWNGTALGPHGFRCTVRARDLLRLYVMNTLGILVSFGLLVPWARVRMARYRVEHMRVTGSGALTDFAQAQADDTGATGAEFGDAMDLDLGL